MKSSVFVYDRTADDSLSKVRGVGRYLQILRENFTDWNFTNKLEIGNWKLEIFINPFFNFLQYPLTMRRIAKKQIAVIHDLIPLKYPEDFPIGLKGKLNIFLNKLALSNYDLIVTDSQVSKEDIVSILNVDKNKVKVIYPCLPKAFTQGNGEWEKGKEARMEVRSKKLVKYTNFQTSLPNQLLNLNLTSFPERFCLYVGDATWNKNLVNLTKAIKIINVTCVFVGAIFKSPAAKTPEVKQRPKLGRISGVDGWQKEFKEFLEEARNDKRFIFAGFVSDEELIQLYRSAKCNVLVSRDEGFGFSYLEAASQACPSVLSDIPILHEISNNQGAIFANPNNPNDIANAIGEIYFNQDVRNKLGLEAQKQAKDFSAKQFKKRWENLTFRSNLR